MATIKAPIWKDTFYTASTSTLVYSIVLGNRTIFRGKAYKMPNENILKLNINKICQDYLEQDIDNILTGSTSQTNAEACLDFDLKNSTGGTINTYRFLYDWDYDHSWTGQSATLTEVVNGHYAAGQWKLATSVNTAGTVTTVSNNSTLYNKEVCGDYVLHYVGAKGWASFVFEGKCTKTDAITPHYFNKAFDNTTAEFEQGKYMTEISTTYKLNTGILSEEEAARFAKNVVSSPKAYLQILSEGKIIPVVITTNQAEYKLEDGQNLITYELNVKESQTKLKK